MNWSHDRFNPLMRAGNKVRPRRLGVGDDLSLGAPACAEGRTGVQSRTICALQTGRHGRKKGGDPCGNTPAQALCARAASRPGPADDLVQDCLERALPASDNWRTGENPRRWLFTIMHHLFVDQMRKTKRRAEVVMLTLDDSEALSVAGRTGRKHAPRARSWMRCRRSARSGAPHFDGRRSRVFLRGSRRRCLAFRRAR